MLEFMICSLITLLPDYLYRRYRQGKRIGKEITLYSVWFELRWGIATCAILTTTLITLIFYYHPSTNSVSSYFRTVTIAPEIPGRVAEVFVQNNEIVPAGTPLFRINDSSQRAAVETAKTKISEVDAAFVVTQSELAAAQGSVEQAEGSLEQALDELRTKQDLKARNPGIVNDREIESLQNVVDSREGALEAAEANVEAVESKISTLLPAQKKSAEAALHQAQVNLDKTVTYAGVKGRLEQFQLKPGDYISSVLRPAGILVPTEIEHLYQAGFGQMAATVLKVGMVTEVACASLPFRIIPMQIVRVQDVIATGQFRPSDNLLDIQDRPVPGTVTVAMRPLFEEQAEQIIPGSACFANAYTDNHERLHTEELSTGEFLFLHTIDTVGLAHAMILRIQAFMLPVRTLVFSGH